MKRFFRFLLALLAFCFFSAIGRGQELSISDRLAAVERQNAVTAASLNGLSERLDRLEAKLDRLLAQGTVQQVSPLASPQSCAPQATQTYADDSQNYATRRILFPRLHKLIFPRRGAGDCASGS